MVSKRSIGKWTILVTMLPLIMTVEVANIQPVNAHHIASDPAGDIQQQHLTAAIETVVISRSARAYVEVIPNLAKTTKLKLTRKYPQFEKDIDRAVNAAAEKLALRQSELETLIALEWAHQFTREELKEISAFFASPVGSKLAARNTQLIAFGLAAAQNWSEEIGNAMVQLVLDSLEAQGKKL